MENKNKVFDGLKFFQDHQIDFQPKDVLKCKSTGWANIRCPICKGQKYYLGFHLESGAWNCWRGCQTGGLYNIIGKILGVSGSVLAKTIEPYLGGAKNALQSDLELKNRSQIKWPTGIVEEIPKKAHNYLVKRKFNPDLLTETWGLKFTGPMGDYKFRILAPIWHNHKLVSYQGRDYTGKSPLRYKACKKEWEVKDHQECLYGSWLVQGDVAVVVEGVADAWRMGPGCIATFGLAYTDSQLFLLSQYKRLFILFDGEEKAIEGAYKLSFLLQNINSSIEIHIVELEDGDPGEMGQGDANHLMKELGL